MDRCGFRFCNRRVQGHVRILDRHEMEALLYLISIWSIGCYVRRRHEANGHFSFDVR